MKTRFILVILGILFSVLCYPTDRNKEKKAEREESGKKIFVENFQDRNTGCKITYEYYKAPDGTKIMHGKYKRQWSLPKGHRSGWSGTETVTATFVDNRLNGVVIINCDKQKWKRKNEFIKGKGRKITLVPSESYVARNLRLEVKNDTIASSFNFELGDLKYEALGKVNELGELKGTYILSKKNTTENTDSPKNVGNDWIIVEQYLCDPDYTYKDAQPKLTEVKLGYNGTSRGEHIHIKIPRLRLSINPM